MEIDVEKIKKEITKDVFNKIYYQGFKDCQEKLYWDLKMIIQKSKVEWINIQKVLNDLLNQSVKEMEGLFKK